MTSEASVSEANPMGVMRKNDSIGGNHIRRPLDSRVAIDIRCPMHADFLGTSAPPDPDFGTMVAGAERRQTMGPESG